MSSKKSVPNVVSLGGLLSSSGMGGQSQNIIINNLDGNQAGLLGATGVGAGDLYEDDVTVVAMVIDQSSSMGYHANGVIAGFNEMLQALRDSKLEDSVIMSLWTFNRTSHLVHNYRPIADVDDLNDSTYQPSGTTALYDTVLDAMSGQVAYITDLQNNGITARGIVVVVSDGEDNESKVTAAKIKTVADDMLSQEIFTLAFFAFGFNGEPIARAMGFDSVLETGNSASELRRGLGTVSKSIIRTSQTQINASGSNFFS